MIFCVKNIGRMISLKNFNIYIHDTQLSKIGFFLAMNAMDSLWLQSIWPREEREVSSLKFPSNIKIT